MSFPSTKLAEVTDKIGSGVTPRGGDSVYVQTGTSLIRSQNIYNSEFTNDGLVYIDDKTATKMKGVTVLKDDVLLNITGDSVARCCKVDERYLPARVNQHVAIVRANKSKLNPDFLMFYLTSPYMQKKMLSWAGSGGTRKALTKGMIEGFEVPTPDIDIQAAISGILKNYNDLIENNKRRIELLEESARQLYKEWFVRFRFPGHEHVKLINGVPEGWGKKKLKELLTLNYGKALKAENRVPGDFPVYGSSGVVGTHNKALVKGPGIIVGRKGNVGSIHWSHLDFFPIDTVYFINAEESSYFIYYALLTVAFISTDVAVPGLNRDFAYSREVIVPTDTLRKEFESEVEPVFKQCHTLEKYNEQLAKARDLLLPKLMSGEISV